MAEVNSRRHDWWRREKVETVDKSTKRDVRHPFPNFFFLIFDSIKVGISEINEHGEIWRYLGVFTSICITSHTCGQKIKPNI